MNLQDDKSPQLNTRDRILEVAARLFAERGYKGTSVRDIAAELGIANPSLYYHFKSKSAVLMALLEEPLRCVDRAVAEANQLSGDARTRRIIEGLLEALEVHSGVALTASRDFKEISEKQRKLAQDMMPQVALLLQDATADEHRELRITMAIGAVEGVVKQMMLAAPDNDSFVAALRAQRGVIIDLVMKLLR